MPTQRDLVILAGAEKTKDPEAAFEQFIRFAENGGVYLKLGRGEPRQARPGCNAYVVFRNHIVGLLRYDGVDDFFESGGSLGGEDDDYTMDTGPALKFVGPYIRVRSPIPYRRGFRSWEYLPASLERLVHTQGRP